MGWGGGGEGVARWRAKEAKAASKKRGGGEGEIHQDCIPTRGTVSPSRGRSKG